MSDIYFNQVVSLSHYEANPPVDDVVAGNWTITTGGTGSVVADAVTFRYGAGSALFSGFSAGNFAQLNQTIVLDFSAAFTIEASFYVTAWTNVNGLYLAGIGTDNDRFQADIRSPGEVSVFASDGGTARINQTTSGAGIALSTWVDVAIGYDGADNLYIYVNGTPFGPYSGLAAWVNSNNNFRWGVCRNSSVNKSLAGNLDESRLTPVDRYGGVAYTPAAFPDQTLFPAGTVWLKTPTGNIQLATVP